MKVQIFIAVGKKKSEDEEMFIGVDSNKRLIDIKRDSFLHSNKDAEAWVEEYIIETKKNVQEAPKVEAPKEDVKPDEEKAKTGSKK
jgi:hypothetical protein